tara:strand:+ start:685 stop:816 length:132 start_codon:yes stop_codon:yes gene_type:complete
MGKTKEWPSNKWPGAIYKGKPVGKYGPLPNPKLVRGKTNSVNA